ncbi:MAG: AAA family ATPase [Candidatus Omnitrophica bacterium]|nr:AAA family ATPase [Candidatus Omnitrophota bacterium]
MKKFLILLRIHSTKIMIFAVMLGLTVFMIYFITYCMQNYYALESFSRRQISGSMGLTFVMFFFVQLLSMPIMIGMQYYFMQGGFANIGKGAFDLSNAKVKWAEVIGMEEAKKDAQELIELLRDRKKLHAAGGKIIKGMLMMGPPGCGKTYLAKAIASECGLPLLSATGSEFVGIFMGVGTARVKTLFRQARALADIHGGCLIFIDEIDSIARPRQQDRGFGGVMDHNATVNQFLTEMDGLRKAENNIVVLAATNVSENELDPAIIRPGRLERKINVTRPNLIEREQIFDLYLGKVEYNKATIDKKILARKTVWFSPAEIESVVREASLLAMRNSHKQIERPDINEAYDRVSFGQKSNAVQPEKDKLWTAYHEAGHALITYLLATDDDVMKATIIPRTGFLGMVFSRPKEENFKTTKEDLLTDIKISLASYIAERKKFGTTGTGVGGGPGADFEQALNTAYKMVWSFGMGPSGIIGDFASFTPRFSYWGGGEHISEETKTKLDADVQSILQSCLKTVEDILTTNWEALDYFAQQLYIKEELDYDEIEAIFHKFGMARLQGVDRSVPENLTAQKAAFQKELAEQKKQLTQTL